MAENWAKAIVYADYIDGLRHGTFVSNLTYLTAKQMGIDEEQCYNMAFAGLLHDIGKIKLSSSLYGRDSSVMEIEEMQVMTTHPKLGYEALENLDIPQEVKLAVLYHHENYDGTGYPFKLKGKNIPLIARVLKVADTFVALISERPYRAAFDIDTAMNIMIEDIHEFDLEVFLAFQKVIHEEKVLEAIKNDELCLELNLEDFI